MMSELFVLCLCFLWAYCFFYIEDIKHIIMWACGFFSIMVFINFASEIDSQKYQHIYENKELINIEDYLEDDKISNNEYIELQRKIKKQLRSKLVNHQNSQ